MADRKRTISSYPKTSVKKEIIGGQGLVRAHPNLGVEVAVLMSFLGTHHHHPVDPQVHAVQHPLVKVEIQA